MMPISLKAFTKKLADDLLPPIGYNIEADPLTDNIIVYNEKLGFCITRKFIDDHVYDEVINQARSALSELVKRTDGLADPAQKSTATFQPTAELLNPPRETVFDPLPNVDRT